MSPNSKFQVDRRRSDEPRRIVHCIGFRSAGNAGSPLAGYADLHLAAPYRLRLFNCPCFVNDGVLSVSMPASPYQDVSGRQNTTQAIAFDDEGMLARFAEEAAAAVLAYLPCDYLAAGDRAEWCGANTIHSRDHIRTVAEVLIDKAYEIGQAKYDKELILTECRWLRDEIADLRREIGHLSQQLAAEKGRQPQGPEDELTTQINAQWQRLYRDYAQYRRKRGYPGDRRGAR